MLDAATLAIRYGCARDFVDGAVAGKLESRAVLGGSPELASQFRWTASIPFWLVEFPIGEQQALAEAAGLEAGHSVLKAAHPPMLRTSAQSALQPATRNQSAVSIWTEYLRFNRDSKWVESNCAAHEMKLLEMTSHASTDALSFVGAVESLHLPWIVRSGYGAGQRLRCPVDRGAKALPSNSESTLSSCDQSKSKFRGGLYPIAYQVHARNSWAKSRALFHSACRPTIFSPTSCSSRSVWHADSQCSARTPCQPVSAADSDSVKA